MEAIKLSAAVVVVITQNEHFLPNILYHDDERWGSLNLRLTQFIKLIWDISRQGTVQSGLHK